MFRPSCSRVRAAKPRFFRRVHLPVLLTGPLPTQIDTCKLATLDELISDTDKRYRLAIAYTKIQSNIIHYSTIQDNTVPVLPLPNSDRRVRASPPRRTHRQDGSEERRDDRRAVLPVRRGGGGAGGVTQSPTRSTRLGSGAVHARPRADALSLAALWCPSCVPVLASLPLLDICALLALWPCMAVGCLAPLGRGGQLTTEQYQRWCLLCMMYD